MKGSEPSVISHAVEIEHESVKSRKVTTPSSRKSKSKRDTVTLSETDIEMLKALKQRCESLGMKISKVQLLFAGLNLLASMPMGKFLAVLGPLESDSELAHVKKKKVPPRLNPRAQTREPSRDA